MPARRKATETKGSTANLRNRKSSGMLSAPNGNDLAMTSEIPASHLLEAVRSILGEARGQVYAAVNAAMVEAHWRIGCRIVEEEQGGAVRAEYGRQIIRNLARDLGDEFGKGLSVANLWNFRQFYLTFPDAGKLYALRRELSWTHWRLVMRVEDPQARDYYIEETARHALREGPWLMCLRCGILRSATCCS